MGSVKESIEVHASAKSAYDCWLQEFPAFLKEITKCERIGDQRYRLQAEVAGKTFAWETKVEANPSAREIVWHSVAGKPNHGKVQFEDISERETCVRVEVEFEAENELEHIAHLVGFPAQRVKTDLAAFKQLVERPLSQTV